MSYDLNRIKMEFNEVCRKAGTPCDVPIRLNGRLTRTLGRVFHKCDITSGVWYSTHVEFSKQLLETASDKSIRDVILHECAHFIVTARTGESHGHDAAFKKVCAEIGTTNDGTVTRVERTVSEDSLYKYNVYCPTCNKTIGGYSRMCRTLKEIDMCRCKSCGKGGLKVIQNW